MRKLKFLIIPLVILACAFVSFFVLRSDYALVFQPKGVIASKIFNLIILNLILMLSILFPTLIWLLITAWKYRFAPNNRKVKYEPEKQYGVWSQVILWLMPSIVVALMAVITWRATHELDPYRRLKFEGKELTIQVVALDWKWLFIYPEQGIATLNFVQFPEKTPIRFELAADGSPMNSFWIPELSGQIYCMTGMITPLHIMADGPGIYSGKAAEINGEGYAKMRFIAKSTSQFEFESWVAQVKTSPLQLEEQRYAKLLEPSIDEPIALFSKVENNLFNKIIMKVNQPISDL